MIQKNLKQALAIHQVLHAYVNGVTFVITSVPLPNITTHQLNPTSQAWKISFLCCFSSIALNPLVSVS